VDIDEPWPDDAVLRVDDECGCSVREPADRDDTIAADADISAPPGLPEPSISRPPRTRMSKSARAGASGAQMNSTPAIPRAHHQRKDR
jgi:hypothetical protein